MDRWRQLMRIARSQHGFFHIGQAPGVGLPPTTVRARAAREGWPHPHRGVFGVPGALTTFEGRVSTAVLAAGDRVLTSRHTAAYLLRITDRLPRAVELVVPYDRRAPRLRGVGVWRSRTLLLQDATAARGLPVTTAPRTLFDLAAICSRNQLRGLVIDALQRRRVRFSALVDICHRIPVARGRRRFRRVLHEVDRDQCDSVLAYAVRRRLRAAGVRPDPAPAAVPAGNRVLEPDVTFSDHQVAIECDGFAYHSSRAQLDRDHRRRNRLAVHTSWTVLSITWDRLEQDWDGFLSELDTVLRARAAES